MILAASRKIKDWTLRRGDPSKTKRKAVREGDGNVEEPAPILNK
jgi:hypothetical protein